MFTLSEKIRVMNSASEVQVFDNTNAVVATSAAVANTDRLFIDGFGHFDVDKISNIKMRRAVAATIDSKDFTCVAPAGLAIGDAIEVIVSLETSRYQSEVLAQNYLGNGRTIKFSTAPLTAVTAAAIRTAIVAGWVAFGNLYTKNTPFIEVVNGTAAADIKVQSLAGYESVSIPRVELKRIQQGIALQTPVSLAINVVNSIGFEGSGTGKFLEESIQMSTPMNVDPYASDTAGTVVDLRGLYTELSFEYSTSYEENLGITAADHGHTTVPGGPATGGVAATHSFTLFLNESTMLAANSAIAKLAAIAVLRSAVYAYLTATVVAAPLTAAQERSEVLIYSDNSSVATVAAFIA